MTSKIKGLLDSKRQLLLDVSHELRSPLTRMRVALEFIQDDQPKKQLKNDIDDLEELVAELLENERMLHGFHELQLEEVDIITMLKKLCVEHEAIAPGVDFYALQPEILLRMDRISILAAFRNLLENALKYSSHQQKPVEVRISQNNGNLIISFKDYGIGIEEKELQRIFEPFYRVDKSRQRKTRGYGLGLSVAEKAIKAHGGELKVLSKIDQGTMLTVSLPLA